LGVYQVLEQGLEQGLEPASKGRGRSERREGSEGPERFSTATGNQILT
jgi:hypothetical protein